MLALFKFTTINNRFYEIKLTTCFPTAVRPPFDVGKDEKSAKALQI